MPSHITVLMDVPPVPLAIDIVPVAPELKESDAASAPVFRTIVASRSKPMIDDDTPTAVPLETPGSVRIWVTLKSSIVMACADPTVRAENAMAVSVLRNILIFLLTNLIGLRS